MATRIKTVEYSFTAVSSAVDNTLTNFPQITIYLPETGTKTFKSVKAIVTADDVITNTGGTYTASLGLRLGSASYTTSAQQQVTNSAENISLVVVQNFTSHFITNWSGTSQTCDLQFNFDQSSGTTLGMVNICGRLEITYEYDDTSTTHIKTVYIPLNTQTGLLENAKPGTANSTIPALDTWLPEASKTYRDCFVVMTGNDQLVGGTTDWTLAAQVDSLTQLTTNIHERALASDRYWQYYWSQMNSGNVVFTTNTTHNFYIWASIASNYHCTAYMVVTYEFNATTTTSVMNSILLPMEWDSPMGGTVVADRQSAYRSLWIQEPGPIAIQQSALFMFYGENAAIAGMQIAVGNSAFTAYTESGAYNTCGGNELMFRCENNITLARGENVLNAHAFKTTLAVLTGNLCSLWMINYTSGKHTSGVGAHNHTVKHNILPYGTAAAAAGYGTSALAPSIPESDYFLTAVGNELIQMQAAAGASGITILTEKLSAEGTKSGVSWLSVYTDINVSDPEVGSFKTYSTARTVFKRTPNEYDPDRIDLKSLRRWRIYSAASATFFASLDIWYTYHTITYTVTGNVTNSDGGTVTLELIKDSNNEVRAVTTRVGNGSYSFTWYDDTSDVYVVAYESGTKKGVSAKGRAV